MAGRGGIKRCANNRGVQRNASNRGVKKCDCLLVYANDCATGYPVDFWMTQRDAHSFDNSDGTVKKFSFEPPTMAIAVTGDPVVGCRCLFFNWAYDNRENKLLPQTTGGTWDHIAHDATTHTPDEVIIQDDSALTVGGVYNCAACGLDAIHRITCASYTVAFHLKIESWNGGYYCDGGTRICPNPHSCIGDNTASPDHTWEGDFSFTVLTPTTGAYILMNRRSASGETYPMTGDGTINVFDVSVGLTCGFETITVHNDYQAYPPTMTSARTRAATIEGVYPDSVGCGQVSSEIVARTTLSGITVTCDGGSMPLDAGNAPESTSRGLGDVVAIIAKPIAKALGLGNCSGCRRRQEKLNNLVPNILKPLGKP